MVDLKSTELAHPGSSPGLDTKLTRWWNGIHTGLRSLAERYEGSSPSLVTKKVAMRSTGSKPGWRV